MVGELLFGLVPHPLFDSTATHHSLFLFYYHY